MPVNPIQVTCTLNGKKTKLSGYPMARLLDVIREKSDLTGTKEGCGEGECGACSVWIDGEVVNSCLVPLAQVEGAKITTIEGLAGKKKLHPLQQCFLETGGAQCGICTPGMLIAASCLLKKKEKPKESEIREWLAGNLCRCTGYVNIVEAVAKAAKNAR